MNHIFLRGLFFLGLLQIISCSVLTSATRARVADELASHHGWTKSIIKTSKFALLSYQSPRQQGSELTVYIEGDGFAWITRSKPSDDPTPQNPIALKLALQDVNTPVVYLARPCQYLKQAQPSVCDSSLWTHARFSEEVIASSNEAVSQFKASVKAEKVNLVGFSGGGAVAALIAARRDDVKRLVTVAGNLDHVAWTQTHHISPLISSLNPADYWENLSDVAQLHLVGSNDKVMPLVISKAYRKQFVGIYQPEIRVIRGANHLCCWERKWKQILLTLK